MPRAIALAILAATLASRPTNSQAAFIAYSADMSGASVTPPTASPATGLAQLGYDSVAHTIRVQVSFTGLLGPDVNAVIHGPTAVPGTGKAGNITNPNFPGFPLGVTAGSYDQTFSTLDTSFYGAGFLSANGGTAAGAEAGLLAALASGEAYFDIHTTTTPNVEIAGFFAPSAVPEPSSVLMVGAGLLGVAAFGRRRRWVARPQCAAAFRADRRSPSRRRLPPSSR